MKRRTSEVIGVRLTVADYSLVLIFKYKPWS